MARNKKTSETLFQFMNLLISLLTKNGQYRTMQHYKATLNSFMRFRGNRDIALTEIDAEEMQALLDKYKNKTDSSPYLFPFLLGYGKHPHDWAVDNKREGMRLYHSAEARIAYHLKKIGERIGIKGKLTLYVARHSWATVARDSNIPVSVISEALGHSSETTTQIYLRSIRTSEVDDANARILAAI